MKTLILDIQKCSIHDGPGLRTTVFLKGCPLSCKWCHNPESQSFHKQLRYFREKCTGCGRCQKVCADKVHQIDNAGKHHIDFEKCTACGACQKVCMQGAIDYFGKHMSLEEVMTCIREDLAFYKKSKGGVTVSGGEPLSHPEFVSALLKQCQKEGIHTCIETSGVGSHAALEQIAPYVDLFLLDYKVSDEADHQVYVGAPKKKVLETLAYLEEKQKPIILRCPIIPGINDRTSHFEAIELLNQTHQMIQDVELMPYHKLGIVKGLQIGIIQECYIK